MKKVYKKMIIWNKIVKKSQTFKNSYTITFKINTLQFLLLNI
jgi:hypothetical protein